MSTLTGFEVRFMRVSLFVGLVCTVLFLKSGDARGDENSSRQLVNLNVNSVLQGEDVDLPEDFIARVEDGKLKVILESLGAQGQSSPRSNLLVALLDENGDRSVATTNSAGVAEFTNVRVDALHALLVNDEKFHAAIPILSISPETALAKNIVASDIRVSPMPADRDAILTSLARDIAPTSGVGSLLAASDFKLANQTAYRVRLNSDGTLDGRVVIADRDLDASQRYANVTIFKDRQPVARTTANAADGSFGLPNLAVGIYGVIASGPAGYSAFAFEVLPPTADIAITRDPTNLPVSLQASVAASKLYVFLIPPKLMSRVRDEISTFYGSGAPSSNMTMGPTGGFPGGGGGFGGGGSGGGGFGGGGSGIGGGGFGGLGALIALPIIIGLADDNNNAINNTLPPVIVSPISN